MAVRKVKEKEVKPITNAQFAQSKYFKELCKRAGTEATKRQASKFKNNKGLAFAHAEKERRAGHVLEAS